MTYSFAKRVLDLLICITFVSLFWPLLLIIAILIKTSSEGPVIFGHTRIGLNGKEFKCLKFRTMVPNAQEALQALLDSDPQAKAEWDKDHKLRNDPRITKVGAFLRKTSLDELPQLWNVFKGEMSAVGPRPIVTAELAKYGKSVNHYLRTKPGMTGLWQVSGRNDVTYNQRVAMDRIYATSASMLMDIKIILGTFKVLLGDKNAY